MVAKRVLYYLWIIISIGVLAFFASWSLVGQLSQAEGITVLENEISHKAIFNYAVNKKGEIAVATSGSMLGPEQYVLVYDAQGAYLYGYQISAEGVVAADWDAEDRILVLYAREQVVRTLDADGRVTRESEMDASEISDRYNALLKRTKEVGDTTYRMRGDHKLIATHEGVETALYTATADAVRGIGHTVVIVAALIGLILAIFRKRLGAIAHSLKGT